MFVSRAFPVFNAMRSLRQRAGQQLRRSSTFAERPIRAIGPRVISSDTETVKKGSLNLRMTEKVSNYAVVTGDSLGCGTWTAMADQVLLTDDPALQRFAQHTGADAPSVAVVSADNVSVYSASASAEENHFGRKQPAQCRLKNLDAATKLLVGFDADNEVAEHVLELPFPPARFSDVERPPARDLIKLTPAKHHDSLQLCLGKNTGLDGFEVTFGLLSQTLTNVVVYDGANEIGRLLNDSSKTLLATGFMGTDVFSANKIAFTITRPGCVHDARATIDFFCVNPTLKTPVRPITSDTVDFIDIEAKRSGELMVTHASRNRNGDSCLGVKAYDETAVWLLQVENEAALPLRDSCTDDKTMIQVQAPPIKRDQTKCEVTMSADVSFGKDVGMTDVKIKIYGMTVETLSFPFGSIDSLEFSDCLTSKDEVTGYVHCEHGTTVFQLNTRAGQHNKLRIISE